MCFYKKAPGVIPGAFLFFSVRNKCRDIYTVGVVSTGMITMQGMISLMVGPMKFVYNRKGPRNDVVPEAFFLLSIK